MLLQVSWEPSQTPSQRVASLLKATPMPPTSIVAAGGFSFFPWGVGGPLSCRSKATPLLAAPLEGRCCGFRHHRLVASPAFLPTTVSSKMPDRWVMERTGAAGNPLLDSSVHRIRLSHLTVQRGLDLPGGREGTSQSDKVWFQREHAFPA